MPDLIELTTYSVTELMGFWKTAHDSATVLTHMMQSVADQAAKLDYGTPAQRDKRAEFDRLYAEHSRKIDLCDDLASEIRDRLDG